jgi:succinate dehydrogenase hydrophobic anchor subunit
MKETKYWFWHILSGIIILFLLGIHMITVHLSSLLGWFNPAGGEAIEWENLIARGRLFIFTAIYILLLATALYHGLYGFRTILFETGLTRGFRKSINIVFILAGISLFALGSWAAVAFYLVAKTA